MSTPVTYLAGAFSQSLVNPIADRLWSELDWVRHDKVPRCEYYVGAEPYSYGVGLGRRTYMPQPRTPDIDYIWERTEFFAGCKFDVCFLNGYLDQSDFLGWHSDDSPEMDDTRPIAIVSLGAERDIWFRPKPAQGERAKPGFHADGCDALTLQNGSLALMAPGMQDTHQHRIPKVGRAAGRRISFTFRGYVKV